MKVMRCDIDCERDPMEQVIDDPEFADLPLGIIRWNFDDDPFPVEGILIKSERIGDNEYHICALVCDEQAARLAVHPGMHVISWVDGE